MNPVWYETRTCSCGDNSWEWVKDWQRYECEACGRVEREVKMDEHKARLIEADQHKIMREAQVRSILEEPGLFERAFEQWYKRNQGEFEWDRRMEERFPAWRWQRKAWRAEARMHAMGRELNVLQQRMGRQRKANRQQHHALKEANERIKKLEEALRGYADDDNWLECFDDQHPEGYWHWLGTEPIGDSADGPGLARTALASADAPEDR